MKKFLSTLVTFSLCAFLAACGSASSDVSTSSASGEKIESAYYADAEYATDSFVQEEVGGEKFVYTGSLTVQTLDFETTVESVKSLIKEQNGIVEHEELSDYDRSWMYDGQERARNRELWMTVRIPTEHFDAFLNQAGETGKVTARSSSVENITRTYNDNATEIEALKIQEERLLAMLSEATTVDDMITIEARLSDVQTELKQKTRYQSEMDTDVEYSTVELVIDEVQKYTEQNNGLDTSNFFGRLGESFKYAGTFTLWFLQSVVLVLVRYLPVAVLVVAFVLVVRKALKKRKDKKKAVVEEKK